jgi:hypothetical protein
MRRGIVRRQRAWARSAGIPVDAASYLSCVQSNLHQTLSRSARAAFETTGAAEYLPQKRQAAKMRALHSSAALVVNVFDYWVERDARALLEALSLDSTLSGLRFEQPLSTGLPGQPPQPDVLLELGDGRVAAVESKFTEWLTPKRRGRPAFSDKYFAERAGLWATRGLPRCQALAADLHAGRVYYRYLDAAQLLKHALGLAAQYPGRCELFYIYFDFACAAAAPHLEDVERFAASVDASLRFKTLTYQSLYGSLSAGVPVSADAGYLHYLGKRYFN